MFLCQKIKIIPEYIEENNYTLNFSSYKNNDIKEITVCLATLYKNDLAIRTEYKFIETTDSFIEGDLNGLFLGIKLAIKLKITNIIVKTSNISIINNINNKSEIKKYKILKLLKDIKNLKKTFSSIKYELISIEENSKVHNMSKDLLLNYLS